MFALNVAAHDAIELQGKETLLGPLQLAKAPTSRAARGWWSTLVMAYKTAAAGG